MTEYKELMVKKCITNSSADHGAAHHHDDEERQQQFPTSIHLFFTLPGRNLSSLFFFHPILIPNQFLPTVFPVQPAASSQHHTSYQVKTSALLSLRV